MYALHLHIFLCLAFKAMAQPSPNNLKDIKEIALAEMQAHARIGLISVNQPVKF